MNRSKEEKVVLITGAASGFGMGAALAFAQKGFRVVATMRNLAGGSTLLDAARAQQLDTRIDCLQLDVTQPETIQQTVEETVKRYGRIDILLNNAGYALGGPVEEIPLDAWRQQFETNLFGLISVTQAVLPVMRAKRAGTIINISSISGRIGLPGYAPYASSKFAVEGFSESLRMELLPFGIHVVLIEPGAYRTSIWKKGFDAMQVAADSPYRALMDKVIAFSRETARTAADPREVVAAIVKAAESPAPRLRYRMGKGTTLLVSAKTLLPWRWLEAAIKRSLR